MPAPFEFAVDPLAATGRAPTGFGTPASDTTPQVCFVPPRRVIPIVFLPGIMGSNLRIKDRKRIDLLRREARDPNRNIAWRPDTFGLFNASKNSQLTAAERQLMLDPSTTAVDVYNPHSTEWNVDGDGRHRNVELSRDFSSPLLASDGPGAKNGRTAHQKARMRGWGEVYFGSYGKLLERVESRMQRIFRNGKLADGWDEVIGVDPKQWQLDPSTPQSAIGIDELKAITKETFFPVHAIGYNWLVSNRKNATDVADSIRAIVQAYRSGLVCRHECPGVIVVTHSMGGLLGRALIHPDMGGLKDLVIGMVHGVQPAAGAAAAYKRMRAGFEDPGMRDIESSVGAKIAGNFGNEVTAVLANSPGGLQLLPTKAYGNGWLRVHGGSRELLSLPEKGDPYEEIYKLRGKWFGLIADESWLNPANLLRDDELSPIEHSHDCIDAAREFHKALADTYHDQTYVHYGADRNNLAFGNVTWRISTNCGYLTNWKSWQPAHDSRQGTLCFVEEKISAPLSGDPTLLPRTTPGVYASIDPPDEAGDQTVPARSADHQKHAGKCKAVFRQTGYDHQGSYQNEAALASTVYSILRIAQRVQLP